MLEYGPGEAWASGVFGKTTSFEEVDELVSTCTCCFLEHHASLNEPNDELDKEEFMLLISGADQAKSFKKSKPTEWSRYSVKTKNIYISSSNGAQCTSDAGRGEALDSYEDMLKSSTKFKKGASFGCAR